MKRLLSVFLGVLTAIGGFVDIGDLVANALAGARCRAAHSLACRLPEMRSMTWVRMAEVRTPDGRRVGVITGLRCTLDGASDGTTPAPRVRALVVTGRNVGAALGYQQEGQRGPWLVRALIRAMHRGSRLVDVELIDSIDGGTVQLSADRG